jgi:hypothetical protein
MKAKGEPHINRIEEDIILMLLLCEQLAAKASCYRARETTLFVE